MRVPAAGLAALLLVIAACGSGSGPGLGSGEAASPQGAATATATPADASVIPAATTADASAAAPSPEAPSAAPAATSAGGGSGSGGFATRPCDLVSQADAEAAAGVTGLSSSVLQIDATSGICSWRDANNAIEVYAGVWDRDAAEAQWAAMEAIVAGGTDGIERVDGLGGDAIYSTSGSVLLVHKGDTLVQLTVRNQALDEAANRAAVLGLGRAVLARM